MSRDSHLQQSVLDALCWDPSVSAGHIGVTAQNGVVTLTGHVATFAEKHAAESAARSVKGVEAVAEEIEVRLPLGFERGDEEIAAAVVERLGWNASIPSGAVKVTVEGGWVTLDGEVEWHYQREAAAADVRHLSGVVGVTNRVRIRPKASATGISDDIMHALHRSWFFDPKTIAVSVDDSRVHLTGTASTPYERQVAAATAWDAPGVTDVKNDIVVVGS